MALLDIQKVDKSGDALNYVNTGVASDTFENSKGMMFHIKNPNVASLVVSVDVVKSPLTTDLAGNLIVPNISFIILQGQDRMFSVPETHTQPGGIVTVKYDVNQVIFVAVFHVAQ
ncbi:MAG: hypothetical protein KAJ19_10515 [Gammaproteobacteria bacterium]|nr:hypothetical protein [Gammaproteobacteria bacterium]